MLAPARSQALLDLDRAPRTRDACATGPMRILLHHGYELSGSGSNEYTRYLARILAEKGHDIIVACGDLHPTSLPFVHQVFDYDSTGAPAGSSSGTHRGRGGVTVHRLPRTSITPVYLTDKQRPGNVAAFVDLTDEQLNDYHRAMVRCLGHVLDAEHPDVVHANHLVWQPVVQADVAPPRSIPYYVVPHGSSIEYTLRRDPRFIEHAHRGLASAHGVVWISDEVRDRVYGLYPDLAEHLGTREARIPIGTDTTLFRPFAEGERAQALDHLRRLSRPGGKTAAHLSALRTALDQGNLDATRAFWDAYDHGVEDETLVEQLRGIEDDDEIVLFFGALTWGKGIHGLIAAVPELLARRPRARLLVVGSGTYREVLEALVYALDTGNVGLFERLVEAGSGLDRDGAPGALEDVQAYARSSPERLWSARGKLASRVTFCGRLDHERLRWLLPWARIACFPSVIKEASPLVFAEALAAGVLPCASDHSGFADGLRSLQAELPDSLTEAMALPPDPRGRVAGIASNLAVLLERADDPTLPTRLSRIARDRYDWSGIADQLLEFIRIRVLGCA